MGFQDGERGGGGGREAVTSPAESAQAAEEHLARWQAALEKLPSAIATNLESMRSNSGESAWRKLRSESERLRGVIIPAERRSLGKDRSKLLSINELAVLVDLRKHSDVSNVDVMYVQKIDYTSPADFSTARRARLLRVETDSSTGAVFAVFALNANTENSTTWPAHTDSQGVQQPITWIVAEPTSAASSATQLSKYEEKIDLERVTCWLVVPDPEGRLPGRSRWQRIVSSFLQGK